MDLWNRRNLIFAVVAVVGIVLDQATKWWIVQNVAYGSGEIIVVPGFLSIVHAHNPGAAFGALGDFWGRWVVFGVFTIVALYVVFDMFRKLDPTDRFMSFALGLVLSGAIGNAIDRIRQQYVVDFIRVYTDHVGIKGWLVETFGTYEWPSFNVADTALVIGVIMFVIHWAFLEKKPAEDAVPPAPSGP